MKAICLTLTGVIAISGCLESTGRTEPGADSDNSGTVQSPAGDGGVKAADESAATQQPLGGGEKVTICHIPPGDPDNARTIMVGDALTAHLALCADAGECDDGNACTHDFCVASSCVHEPLAPDACDDFNVCTDDTCDPATGGCVNDAEAADGLACLGNGDDACSGPDTCLAGVCEHNGPNAVPSHLDEPCDGIAMTDVDGDCFDGGPPGPEYICDDPGPNDGIRCDDGGDATCSAGGGWCTAYWQGQSPVRECDGGSNDGNSCDVTSDCPDGNCVVVQFCRDVGPNHGIPCTPGADDTCSAGGGTCVSSIGKVCEEAGFDPLDPCITCTYEETGCGVKCLCDKLPYCYTLDPDIYGVEPCIGTACPLGAVPYILTFLDPCAGTFMCENPSKIDPATGEVGPSSCQYGSQFPCFEGLDEPECLVWADGTAHTGLGGPDSYCTDAQLQQCQDDPTNCPSCFDRTLSNQNCVDKFWDWWNRGCPMDVNDLTIQDPSLCTANAIPVYPDDYSCYPYFECNEIGNFCQLGNVPLDAEQEVLDCCYSVSHDLPFELGDELSEECAADPEACCNRCNNRVGCGSVNDPPPEAEPDNFFYCVSGGQAGSQTCEEALGS